MADLGINITHAYARAANTKGRIRMYGGLTQALSVRTLLHRSNTTMAADDPKKRRFEPKSEFRCIFWNVKG